MDLSTGCFRWLSCHSGATVAGYGSTGFDGSEVLRQKIDILLTTMEVYKDECREILKRFMDGRITYPKTVAALDAALDSFILIMHQDDLEEVRSVAKANKRMLEALRPARHGQ